MQHEKINSDSNHWTNSGVSKVGTDAVCSNKLIYILFYTLCQRKIERKSDKLISLVDNLD